jgi:hypothetical protein
LSRLTATTRSQDRLFYSRQRDYMSSNDNLLAGSEQIVLLAGSMRSCTLMFWIVVHGTIWSGHKYCIVNDCCMYEVGGMSARSYTNRYIDHDQAGVVTSDFQRRPV